MLFSSGFSPVTPYSESALSSVERSQNITAIGRTSNGFKIIVGSNFTFTNSAQQINGISISSDEDVIAFVGNDR